MDKVHEDGLCIRISTAGPRGYTEDRTLGVACPPGRWSHLRVGLEHGMGERPLRIQMAATPGVLDIAGIVIRSAVTGESLWRATARAGFPMLELAGAATRLPHPRLARIAVLGADSHVALPHLDGADFDGPLQLELWLKAEPGSDALHDLIARTNAETGAFPQQMNGARQSAEGEQTGALAEKLRIAEAEIDNLRVEAALQINAAAISARESRTLADQLSQIHERLAVKEARAAELESRLESIAHSNSKKSSVIEQLKLELDSALYQISVGAGEIAELKKRIGELQRAARLSTPAAMDTAAAPHWTMRLWELARKGTDRDLPAEEAAPKNAPATPDARSFWVDTPSEPSPPGVVTVSGWAIAPGGYKPAAVRARTGGRIFEGRYGTVRGDVAKALPDHPHSLHSGFKVDIELAPGLHEIAIELRQPRGEWDTVCSFEHEVLELSPAAAGIDIRIDAPAADVINDCGLVQVRGTIRRLPPDAQRVSVLLGDSTPVPVWEKQSDNADTALDIGSGTQPEIDFLGYVPVPPDFHGELTLAAQVTLTDGRVIRCCDQVIQLTLPPGIQS